MQPILPRQVKKRANARATRSGPVRQDIRLARATKITGLCGE
ncbi:hypothetical protein HDF13_001973 [Edaphobacter lichenicola]|uniref:Uncharacterized protein n=1 Tax=Tunturiibacter gelidiferens TaxID=3069689 RepID=A0ACC5NYL2_9BACT|nr:hypothetical protein [Edaphobacter lichenicola]